MSRERDQLVEVITRQVLEALSQGGSTPASPRAVAVGQVVLVLAGAPDRIGGAATDVLRIVRVA